ncbi:helix-turn-helix domain-containing protein [Paracoccus onubensis]|uniref:Helix-turn-helix domain-containing protein n=1 Tax=Paracoccus onubensis TaxID=1675788 RepID=A0A418SPS2_9RHOB|nr:helix-turn-helix domain-containing protein [Paracoccus onubensis]RJE82935.1 helix-turn-helix domain-containing protein [Paracoccus onubensis]
MSRLRADSPADEVSHIEETSLFFDDDTRLGDIMRGERATLGKSLLDVQRELRIRASYIAAIENCDISAFDAPSFIAGYVRSYARYLHMDTDWTFRRFCLESGFQPTHGMAPAASGPKPARRPSDPAEALANPHALFIPQRQSFWSEVEPKAIGSILVLAVLVCGLAYGGWTALQEIQRVTLAPGDDAPEISVELDPTQSASLPGSEMTAEEAGTLVSNLPKPEALDRVYRPQILEAPVLNSRDGPIASIDPNLSDIVEAASISSSAVSETQVSPVQTSGANTVLAQAMQYGPQMPDEQIAVRTVAPDAPELQLLASRPAWVRVTSADGTVLLEKIMDAGERFTLPKLEEAPTLRTGNSGAVYFAVSGRTYGPAAPGPQVVKNIELSPANLTSRYSVADLKADPELAEMMAVAQADTGDDPQGSAVTE